MPAVSAIPSQLDRACGLQPSLMHPRALVVGFALFIIKLYFLSLRALLFIIGTVRIRRRVGVVVSDSLVLLVLVSVAVVVATVITLSL